MKIAVVVPAHDEERLIARTLATIPTRVDAVYPVDDASTDATWAAIQSVRDARIRPLRHTVNRGVGSAIVSGYQAALADAADVLVVMAGDGQMDPDDLSALVEPVLCGRADYVKGNRFVHPERRRMPITRRAGGALLSSLTRVATGLAVDDTQCGYTALSARAARSLPLSELWPRYGYPNDLLGMLAEQGLRVAEVPVRPVYADERSGIRPWHVLTIAGIVGRRYLRSRLDRALDQVLRPA